METAKHNELKLDAGEYKNPRQVIAKTPLKELADSIATQGLLSPLVVWRGPDGPVIVDGGRRWRAVEILIKAKKAGKLAQELPVTYVEADSIGDARLKAICANQQREDLNSFEIATTIHELLEAGYKQQDVAKALSKSATWVSRTMSAYYKATTPVKAAWKAGKLPDDDVQTLAKLPAPEQEKRLEKALEYRESAGPLASRNDRSKARKAVKGTIKENEKLDKAKAKTKAPAKEPSKTPVSTPKPQYKVTKPATHHLASLADELEEAPDKPYFRGMLHGIQYALGARGIAEFDEQWIKYLDSKAQVSDREGGR